MMNMHMDLVFLEEQIRISFDLLFEAPPIIDDSDPLDGEMLSLYKYKSYCEIPDLLSGDGCDFPFFSLIENKEGLYYLGGYMLYFIKMISLCRDTYPVDNFGYGLGMQYITMMSFLQKNETTEWMRSIPRIAGLMVNFLDAMVNTSGIDFSAKDLENIKHLRACLKK